MFEPPPEARADPVLLVLCQLEELGIEAVGGPDQWQARCPAHEDRTPSLSITRGDDRRALVHCHAGCTVEEITRAIGLEPRHLFPDRIEPAIRPTPRRKRVETPDGCWARAAEACRRRRTPRDLRDLAARLGVSEQSLDRLEVGWAERSDLAEMNGGRARTAGWTFPMRNGRGLVVGINVRAHDGSKWTVKGGRLGLFTPRDFHSIAGHVYCVEGASDTAAMLDAGLLTIGRPSSAAGAADVAELCRGRPGVIVVGENDSKGSRWPGLDGATVIAKRVASELRIEVPVVLPPAGVKDAREWWRSGGAKTE